MATRPPPARLTPPRLEDGNHDSLLQRALRAEKKSSMPRKQALTSYNKQTIISHTVWLHFPLMHRESISEDEPTPVWILLKIRRHDTNENSVSFDSSAFIQFNATFPIRIAWCVN